MHYKSYLVVAFIFGFLAAAMLFNEEVRYAFSLDSNSLESPSDHIKVDDLHVFKDRAVIDKANLMWATIKDTHSMEPVLNSNSISLELLPQLPSDIELGDIISYKAGSIVLIHRVVDIGNDGDWFAVTKGDNNKEVDDGKVRFSDIKGVVVGVLY